MSLKNDIFYDLAEIYDFLHQSKSYSDEVKYVKNLCARFGCHPRSILEFGCGTGGHAEHLANDRIQYVGVDLSDKMIEICRSKTLLGEFRTGNLVDMKFDNHFDLVLALFHVLSYQTTDDQVRDTFRSASINLAPGGYFLFDYWYEPGVLNMKPQNRFSRINAGGSLIEKTCTATNNVKQRIATIDYEIDVFGQDATGHKNIRETHKMRYFSESEIKRFAKEAGLQLVASEEFLTSKPLSEEVWGACALVTKKL